MLQLIMNSYQSNSYYAQKIQCFEWRSSSIFHRKSVFPYKCVILEAAVQIEVEVEVEDAPSYATDLIPNIQIFKNFLGND